MTTIVLSAHPVLFALVGSGFTLLFIGGSLWLAAQSRGKDGAPRNWYHAVVGLMGALLFGTIGVWWWQDWSPHAVEFGDDAIELKYLFSIRRIPYNELERVEFEWAKLRRGRERTTLRLSAHGRVDKLTMDPEPYVDLAERPVRRAFDELAKRVPAHIVHDVQKSYRN